MSVTLEGHLIAKDLRIAIVVGRFNNFLSERLLEGALDTINRHGGDLENVVILRAPGAFEIPMVAKKLVQTDQFNAVVCLGVLIRGATPHFDWISSEVTKGIANVSLASGIPVAYGVITTDTIEQAIERSGTKAGNKGHEATLAAIEMANLYKALDAHLNL